MDEQKRQRLEAAGWCVADAADFLELTPEEVAVIEMKLALGRRVKELRLEHNLSQQSLATKINSSQSRVAKMEVGDPSVSLDLLIRTLLAIGATRKELALTIAGHGEY